MPKHAPFQRFSTGRLALVVAAAAAATLPGAATPPAAAQPGPPLVIGDEQAAGDPLADHFAAASQAVLSETRDAPTADQLARARTLLELALERLPDDAGLLRSLVDLARLQEDEDAATAYVQRLAAADPDDHAAVRDAALAPILAEQNSYDRVAAVTALLDGPDAASMPAPVRAELAARAAAWADQSGDVDASRALLRRALEDDAVNLAAVDLLVAQLARQEAPPEAMGIAWVQLVHADPARPGPRAALAAHLAREGCYRPAVQQYVMATAFAGRPDPATVKGFASAMLGAGESRTAVALVSQFEAALAQAEAPQPLPMDLALLRQVGLHGADTDAEREAWAALRERLDALVAADPEAGYDRAWIVAMLAPTPPDTAEQTTLLEGLDADDPVAVRARGWFALRTGDTDAATGLLRRIGSDDRAALVGLALMQPEARTPAFLTTIIKQDPMSLASLFACTKLRQLGGEPEPTEAGERTILAMNRMPRKLWEGDPSILPWTAVSVAIDPTQADYLQPINATISFRNSLNVPLGVGDGRAVPELGLIKLTVSLDGRPLGPDVVRPIFFSLDRRLTIAGGETIRIPVRIDRSLFGLIDHQTPFTNVTYSAEVITAPQLDQRRLQAGFIDFTPGLFGGSSMQRNLVRLAPRPSPAQLEADLAAITVDDPATQRAAINRLLTLDKQGPPNLSETDQPRVRAAIDDAFDRWSPDLQAWALLSMPTEPEATLRYRRAVQTAMRSDSRAVQVALLASLVTPTDRTALTPALRSEDEVVRAYAEATATAMDRLAALQAEAEAARAGAQPGFTPEAQPEPEPDEAPLK